MADRFEYKYNAPTQEERKEIDSILKEYLPKDSKISKLERLRSLDFKVKNTPSILGLSLGIIGILVFGLGLACILEWNLWLLGLLLCFFGIGIASISYPLYKVVYRRLKAKYSDEIIALSKELLNTEDQ